ncbi:12985_t:CDS:1 [Acaulospora morrowiae]|uniref:12985_t:CDS:1 n=1 Tax=Acaulospora morrowiae TaxID=94023 RepID=A0A9N9HRJ3_9GLOM|nr:12985_t:CDS:1 [Acaulospora morrowiae]
MLRGRPPLKEIRKHFEKIEETDNRKTARQRCKHCGNSIIDLIDRLKNHLIKCKKLPNHMKDSLYYKIQNNSFDSDSEDFNMSSFDQKNADKTLAKFFYSTGIAFTAIENPFWHEFMKIVQPTYISPNRRNLANNLLDAEYQIEQEDLKKILENTSTITLASDGWSNIRQESVLNFILYLPNAKPVFYDAKYTGSESHTAEYIYNEIKSVIETIGSSKFVGVITDNANTMRAAWKRLNQDYPKLICLGCNAHIGHLLVKDIIKHEKIDKLMIQVKQIINFFHSHQKEEAILSSQPNSIRLIQPSDTRWGTYLASIQSIRRNKLGLQMTIIQHGISNKINHNLREQILGDTLWEDLDKLASFLEPFIKLIFLFESDTLLLSHAYDEWQKLRELINIQNLELDFKSYIISLIDKRFEFAFHPAMAIANLLDPR